MLRASSRAECQATQLERGDYEIKARNPHVSAGVLKSWLRDLGDPLVPYNSYSNCIALGQ